MCMKGFIWFDVSCEIYCIVINLYLHLMGFGIIITVDFGVL